MRHILLLAGTSLLLTGCATSPRTQHVDIPPAVERMGKGTARFVTADQPGIDRACLRTGLVACAHVQAQVVVLPDPCDYLSEYYASLFCHELSHLFGPYKDPAKKMKMGMVICANSYACHSR